MFGVWYPLAREGRLGQHFIVCGTFKDKPEPYGQRFGGRGVLGIPTLALWPNEYRVAAYDNPETAVMAMRNGS